MKQRAITLLLLLGCVVFGVTGFLIFASQDQTAPEIMIEEKNISYEEGEGYGVLLEGVTAKDDVEGEISDKVFVDKIVDMGNGEAIVHYGVLDSDNNVGTGKRIIEYSAPDSGEEDGENTQEEDEEEKETSDKEKEKTDKKEDSAKNNENDEGELKPNGEKPALALTKKSMTIKKGEDFDALSLVKNVVDDQDDRSTLYQHISVEGKYNVDKTGTYKITYYVTDTDKNTSEPVEFTLKVK